MLKLNWLQVSPWHQHVWAVSHVGCGGDCRAWGRWTNGCPHWLPVNYESHWRWSLCSDRFINVFTVSFVRLPTCCRFALIAVVSMLACLYSGNVIRMDETWIPNQVFYGQLHRPGGQYKRYKDCLKTTLNRCGITPSELETLMMDRTDWHSLCKSAL